MQTLRKLPTMLPKTNVTTSQKSRIADPALKTETAALPRATEVATSVGFYQAGERRATQSERPVTKPERRENTDAWSVEQQWTMERRAEKGESRWQGPVRLPFPPSLFSPTGVRAVTRSERPARDGLGALDRGTRISVLQIPSAAV